MLNKKIMLLTIVIVSLLAVSAVSAADNTTNNAFEDNSISDISENTETGIIGVDDMDEDVIIVDNYDFERDLLFQDNNDLSEGGNESINVTIIPINCEANYSTGNFTFRIADGKTNSSLSNKNVNVSIVDNEGYSIQWIIDTGGSYFIGTRTMFTSDENGIITIGNCNFYPSFIISDHIFPPAGNYTFHFSTEDNEIDARFPITINALNIDIYLDLFGGVNASVNRMTTLGTYVNSSLTIYDGTVTFFDGKNKIGEVNVVDGVATLNYVPKSVGKHSINAFFNSKNYGISNGTMLIDVDKSNVDFSFPNDHALFTDSINFVFYLDYAVDEGEIKLYADDVLIGTSDVNKGVASIDYVPSTAGTFLLKAAYNGTDNYFALNVTQTFQILRMPTTLSGESVIFDEDSNKTFITELKDDNGKGIAGQPVKIEVIKYSGENAVFTGVSDVNGIAVYDVGKLAGGMWYVVGTYDGNGNYVESRFADKFIVVRLNTTTDLEKISDPKVNHSYKLKANIHDETGKLVKEGIVRFYLDGVDIGSIDLSKNQGYQSALSEGALGAIDSIFEYELGAEGDVSDLYLNYVPTTTGKHNLTAVYEGTTVYKSSNSTTSFEVEDSNKMGTVITAQDVTTVYNGGNYLLIKLNDVFDNNINGVKLTVVLNGRTLTPTVANGQVKVSTNGLAPVKTYTAKIIFAGNSKYDKSAETVKVTVKKATLKLTAKAKTLKRSDKTKKYTVTLKTNQNKVMKNTKVTITVNKKTYSAKTNSKGVATFKLTKLTKKGKYTAVVKYSGSKYYNAKTVKPKITLK